MGSSIALHLAQAGHKGVIVVERDNAYKQASCMLSAGGIRQQFSVKENILISLYGIDFIKNAYVNLAVNGDETPDLQFRENGYLFLATNDKILKENSEIQRASGVDWINLFSTEELATKFPWLNTDGLSIGSFSSQNEGYFDPWGFVNSMKKKVIWGCACPIVEYIVDCRISLQAISLGVQYIEGTVVDATTQTSTQSGVVQVSSFAVKGKDGRVQNLEAETFVNAAGAWAGRLVDLIAAKSPQPGNITSLPVKPRKRCIFTVHCPGQQVASKPVPPSNTPLVIDPTGVYFRPEGSGGRFITGVSPTEENDPDCEPGDIDIVDHHLFEDIIWPVLYERVPAFQELKVQSSWAGFYEYNTLDQVSSLHFKLCHSLHFKLCHLVTA